MPVYGPLPMCRSTCEVSAEGLAFIRRWEGFSPVPYADVAGKMTIGVGHLILPGEDFSRPLTPTEADALLKTDARAAVKGVNRRVKVELRQSQFDALVSWTFNLGEGALSGSTMLKKINAGLHNQVPLEIKKWDKARVQGVLKPVSGLTARREDEAKMYRSADV